MTASETLPMPVAPGWDIPPVHPELTEENAVGGALGGFQAMTDLAACVLPLLTALNWEGDLIHVAEALPHFSEKLELTDLLNVMANLGYKSRSLRVVPAQMDTRLMPCLFTPDKGLAVVLVRREGDGVQMFSSAMGTYVQTGMPNVPGTVHLFQPLTEEERAALEEAPKDFVGNVLHRFRPLFLRLLGASLVANLLILATPLFIMAVYDQFLPTGSVPLLASLLVGVAIALAGDAAIRHLRSRMIAYLGARIDHLFGMAIFRRLLFLAPPYTEQANSNAQIARLRDFELVREFFTGPLATTLAEAPFIFIFVIVMAILGGPLVFVPLGALILFLAAAAGLKPLVELKVNAASRAASRRQEFLVEALSKPRAIKESGATDAWHQRFREISAEAAVKTHESARLSAVVATFSQGLVAVTGLTTLGWGVERVLAGEMTVGQLMASMIVIWWVLRPLQTGFSLATQVERVRNSIAQINRLMQVKPERVASDAIQALPRAKGKIALTNVSLRYNPDADPAVLGVSFVVEPGEIVAIVGPNGSGKSSILKLVLGLYRPQTGSVQVDDIDIRQVDPIEYRRMVAYVPQHADLFFGTIAQNLRLVSPIATDEELRWACREAGVLDEIEDLPKGFDTRVGDGRSDRIPASLLQRLSLARAYLKRAPIILFDEPASGLDFASDRQFMLTLERMRGHCTVLLVTHRPSHLKLADKIVVMTQGQVRMAGPAAQVAERLAPGFF